MTSKEELEALLEEIAWLKELIEDALEDTGMSVFEEQWSIIIMLILLS